VGSVSPPDRDSHRSHAGEEKLQRDPHPQKIHEMVAPLVEDHEIGLVPHRGHQRVARGKDDQEHEGIIRHRLHIALDGMKVFQFSLREVQPNVITLLEKIDKQISDIDYFIFHQANKLMNESIRKKLKIEAEKYPYSIATYGNTSSASIPLTINATINEEAGSGRLKMLFSGFGVGLSWGSVYVETERIYCPPVIEV